MKLVEGVLQGSIRKDFKVIFSAFWTATVVNLCLLNTWTAEAGATTSTDVWVTEYQYANWTFRFRYTHRWSNQLTFIAAIPLQANNIYFAMRCFCSSFIFQLCLGQWSCLLPSKFWLLCIVSRTTEFVSLNKCATCILVATRTVYHSSHYISYPTTINYAVTVDFTLSYWKSTCRIMWRLDLNPLH